VKSEKSKSANGKRKKCKWKKKKIKKDLKPKDFFNFLLHWIWGIFVVKWNIFLVG